MVFYEFHKKYFGSNAIKYENISGKLKTLNKLTYEGFYVVFLLSLFSFLSFKFRINRIIVFLILILIFAILSIVALFSYIITVKTQSFILAGRIVKKNQHKFTYYLYAGVLLFGSFCLLYLTILFIYRIL